MHIEGKLLRMFFQQKKMIMKGIVTIEDNVFTYVVLNTYSKGHLKDLTLCLHTYVCMYIWVYFSVFFLALSVMLLDEVTLWLSDIL
jgi:hypothetical protein